MEMFLQFQEKSEETIINRKYLSHIANEIYINKKMNYDQMKNHLTIN